MPSTTEEIDFSTDSFYLMYHYDDERVVIDLNTMDLGSPEFVLEWVSTGNRNH